MRIALIGNPNSGKTTLYNLLTNSSRTTGNRSGVTVDVESRLLKGSKDIEILDFPGIYSFGSNEEDERIAEEKLRNTQIDLIVNVLDGTHLERSLNLSLFLKTLNKPIVLAINFADDLIKNNIKIDVKRLGKEINCKTVLISAKKNIGITELLNVIKDKETIKNYDKKSNVDINNLENLMPKIINGKITKAEIITEKIDKILLNKFLGFPILFLIMVLLYYLSFSIGGLLSEKIQSGFSFFTENLKITLEKEGLAKWFYCLICDGAIKGIGVVVSFLPQVLILFVLLSFLESVGYTSRIVFMLDKLFNKFNLSGKSAIPLFLSCGCTISGISSTRTIENKEERKLSVLISPFMPCSAKSAVFGYISSKLFNGNPFLGASFFFLGIIVAMVFLKIYNFVNNKKEKSFFILELPTYRLPILKETVKSTLEKSKDFLYKAGSLIFIMSIVVFFLKNFGINGYTNGEIEKSFIYTVGNAIKYIFVPLGFGNYKASVAVLSGIFAREGIIETLELTGNVKEVFNNNFSAYSFCAFILLMPPCISALSEGKKELKDNKLFVKMIVIEYFIAYSVSLIINLIGIIYSLNLILYFLFGIILLISIIKCIKRIKKFNCNSCCAKECKCNQNRSMTT